MTAQLTARAEELLNKVLSGLEKNGWWKPQWVLRDDGSIVFYVGQDPNWSVRCEVPAGDTFSVASVDATLWLYYKSLCGNEA